MHLILTPPSPLQGVLSGVVPQLRQVFERIGGGGSGGGRRSPADARFEHFRAAVWPRLQSSGATGVSALRRFKFRVP